MRPKVVIVVPPRFDDLARFDQACEHMLVEALVAQLAVEAFDECGLTTVSIRGIIVFQQLHRSAKPRCKTRYPAASGR